MGLNDMEHPGVDINDLKKLPIKDVQDKLVLLTSRLNFAYTTQNQPLIYQLQMLLSVYNRAQIEMLNEKFGEDRNSKEARNKIDIS